ncbi:MAG TPA: CoA-binding protein [bacterium]|jgi:predicted CoA-binding protein
MPRGRAGKSSSSWSDPRLIREILTEVRSIAVVGISDNPSRPSFGVARYLIEHGYRVVGVNPKLEDVLGDICYPTLSRIPEPIDLVDVFRKPDVVDAIVDEVVKLHIPYLWLQEGVVQIEAAKRAQEAGVKVIMDQCIMKEHSRLGF